MNKQNIESNKSIFHVRSNEIYTSLDDKIEGLSQNLSDNLTALANGEDAKHQRISNTCTMLETDLNTLNEKYTALNKQNDALKYQLAGLSVQHTETIQQMKEVTVLATNIDVHVKQQQELMSLSLSLPLLSNYFM